MEKLLKYFLEINKIKDVERYSAHHEIFRESVADHSFLMIYIASELIEEYQFNLDFKKVVDLIRIHDVCEIGMKCDYDAVMAKYDHAYAKQKKEHEMKNILHISDNFDKKILPLFVEFEKQQTEEAKFVRAIDKIETTFYELFRGCKYFDSAEFIATYPDQAIKNFPQLMPFYKELKKLMKDEYQKAGLLWKDDYNID